MKILWTAVAAIALAPLLAHPEVPSIHASPAPLNIAVVLGIDAARAEVVQSVLEAAHQRRMAAMEAIRAETEQQLAAVLTAEEMQRLQASLPPPPRPGGHRRGTAM